MAIAFDATSSKRGTSTTSLTQAHTCSGSNRFLIVGTYVKDGSAPSGVTYNGVAMSHLLVAQEFSFGQDAIDMWGLVAPATGSNDIVVTCPVSNTEMTLVALSYTGVNQSTPTGTAVGNFGGTAEADAGNGPMTVTVTGVNAGEIVVDMATPYFALTVPTVGAGQTKRGELDDTGTSGAWSGMSEESGSGSITMSWTLTTTGKEWGIGAVAIKPATGGGDVSTALSGSASTGGSGMQSPGISIGL